MSNRVVNGMMQSRIGFAGLILFCFGFLALMTWTGGLLDHDRTRTRHLAWFIENVIVETMGRGLGATLTACTGIVLAIAVYTVGNRR